MDVAALAPYERALRRARPLALRTAEGGVIPLDVPRWLAGVDAADETVLVRCRGPVLDVGCGPGRLVAALTARGVAALGVDIAETAVEFSRGAGRPALLRDVFAALPGEGRWPTALLIDGNIGIGGDPARLLARIRALLAPAGQALVEVDADPSADALLDVRFSEHGRPIGPAFGWAMVGLRALRRYAAGFAVADAWTASGRTFVALRVLAP